MPTPATVLQLTRKVEGDGWSFFITSTVFWPTQQESKHVRHCSSQQTGYAKNNVGTKTLKLKKSDMFVRWEVAKVLCGGKKRGIFSSYQHAQPHSIRSFCGQRWKYIKSLCTCAMRVTITAWVLWILVIWWQLQCFPQDVEMAYYRSSFT